MNIPAFLASFGLLIIAMTIHEFAHGLVAYKLGDPTAKYSGRLTLNPLAHIDPYWTLIFPLLLFIASGGRFIFGSAKPVPINYLALRNPKRDIMWVGASGPFANLIFAFALSVLWKLLPSGSFWSSMCENLIFINVILGVFNLIPIPPLDGSRIVMGMLPAKSASLYASVEPYGFIIIMLLLFFGILDYILWPLVGLILHFFMSKPF